MNARLEHVGVWVLDLDGVAAFYARHFGASIGERYENPRKGFASRFLSFGEGARLELMTRTNVTERVSGEPLGLAHVAIALANDAAVDAKATELRAAGVPILDGPRRTGDGYYECVATDPEGNRIEIAAG